MSENVSHVQNFILVCCLTLFGLLIAFNLSPTVQESRAVPGVSEKTFEGSIIGDLSSIE